MLRKLSHGRIGYLITADETRLARDVRLQLAFDLALARYGVTPISSASPSPIDTLQRQYVLHREMDE